MALNISFMIGNGFDLNLGLKTLYKDFYYHIYNKYPKSDKVYQNIFFERINKDIENWQDFEKMLGVISCYDEDIKIFKDRLAELDFCLTERERQSLAQKILNGKSKIDSDSYRKSLSFFMSEFRLYIIEQENNFYKKFEDTYFKELFQNTLLNFWRDFDSNNQEWFKELIRNNIESPEVRENKKMKINLIFFNFNYTDTLSRVITSSTKEELNQIFFEIAKEFFSENDYRIKIEFDVYIKVYHVHSTKSQGMFLGVDNFSQINTSFFDNIRMIEQLVKPERVKDRFPNQVENSINILNSSDFIYVYGLSLGATDKMWWESLINLVNQKDIKIAIHNFDLSKNFNPNNFFEYDDNSDEVKNMLLNYNNYYTDAEDRDYNRRLRTKIIPIMNSDILFKPKGHFYWTNQTAIDFYEDTFFNPSNAESLDINLSNYSRDSWKVFEQDTLDNEIVLHWSNISGAGGSFVKFISNSLSTEIFTYGGNASYPNNPDIKYIVDNTSKIIIEKVNLYEKNN